MTQWLRWLQGSGTVYRNNLFEDDEEPPGDSDLAAADGDEG